MVAGEHQAPERWLGLLVTGGLVLLPASFFLARDYGDSARVFYLLILLPTLLALPWWLRNPAWRCRHGLLFLLPPAWLALSVAWLDPALATSERSTWYLVKPLVFLAALWLAALMAVGRYPALPRWLGLGIGLVAVPSALLTLANYLPQALAIGDWTRLEGISLRGDVNVTATLYSVAAIFLARDLPTARGRWRIARLLALALFLAIALLSRSKVPLLALLCIFALLLQHTLRRLRLPAQLALVAVPLALLAAYMLFLGRVPLLERPEGYLLRLELWSQTLEQARAAWWIGHGVGAQLPLYLPQQPVIGHAHNILLDTLRTGGLIGALLLLLQISLGGLLAWRVARREPDWRPVAAWWGLGVFFLMTNGQHPLVKPHHIWFYYWVPLALLLARDCAPRLSSHPRADRAAH